ncbi:helix-turn-helix domain-containing protein [Alicyclobacillus fodiniaquatilis]|uniref:Helix-turn-helix domain-containing protein n=1 Tax=Alicyclobacillus fodiniaquatilis TaxID=1661150 RepID=A0ABW4JDK1_9BACL
MIGAVLQSIRQERRMSLSEVAERAGIAKSYLSNIERDIQMNPSIQILNKICNVLGVSVPAVIAEANKVQEEVESLDQEWIDIVREAQRSGIDKEEFKKFMEFQVWRKTNSDN